jgi:two-component system CheB/CheR fusion protein
LAPQKRERNDPEVAAAATGDARSSGSRETFPIVGIGASAGGLEALEVFLRHVPKNSGMAFVIVQHLDPRRKGMLVELLQRVTTMPVDQAADRITVEPDHVYVIPPNRDMSLLHGALHLLPQTAPHGLNLPIDFFFRSLAQECQARSIAVILSGMGTDGTLGVRAIKENAGAAFVQSLDSAKFDGMPRSVIDAGLADVVAPVEELPGKIIAYRDHTPHIARPDIALQDKALSALDKVFALLRAQTGSDFSLYKNSTIYRRIERRMGLLQISKLNDYVRYLRQDGAEIDLLFRELMIGVTSFFRDPAAWDCLKAEIPSLLNSRSGGGLLRAWVPGCSTGEEAYSLAIIFKEAIEELRPMRNIALQIFATDLDRDAIEKARQGVFPDSIAADVSPERLRRFFAKDERGYRVSKEVREMVVFAPQDIITDPPFTKLDILCCRNLLIYFSAELQKKIIPLFHYSLNPSGVLFLGSAETVGAFSGLFSPLNGRTRIYRKLDQPMSAVSVDFPSSTPQSVAGSAGDEPGHVIHKPPPANIQALADRYIVQHFSTVGVLCNENGDILYISGRAGKYLEPAVGKATLNIFAMARDGLRFELSAAFSKAIREERMVTVNEITVGINGASQVINLSVHKLSEPKEMRGSVMVMISDVEKPTELRPAKGTKVRQHTQEPARVSELEGELQRAREEIQTTREEMQASQEELKSTNEELQSTNEELQSTNEELTTSKEEMQSLNEELQTVNHELQSKVDELSHSNNDMKNLLNSTDIATLFLDGDLRVRRFTTPTSKIIKLIPSDAGRPITDIASELEYPDLVDDSREVLRTLVYKEKQCPSRDGRWFAVRIMPYRTLENVIDGVVITFTDVTAFRKLELSLQDQANQLRQITESLPVIIWGCSDDGACDYLSPQWVEYTGVPEADQRGTRWLDLVHPEDRERARSLWNAAVGASALFEAEVRLRGQRGEYRWFKMRSTAIRDPRGNVLKWYGTATDVDDIKRADAERPNDTKAGAVSQGSEGLDQKRFNRS